MGALITESNNKGKMGSELYIVIENDTGEVGIGITNPTEKLEVNGNIQLLGTSTVKGVAIPTAADHVATKGYVDTAGGTAMIETTCAWMTSALNNWPDPGSCTLPDCPAATFTTNLGEIGCVATGVAADV